MLSIRSTRAEWMDSADAGQPEFEAALRDLARINRLSFAHAPVLRWLEGLARPGERLTVLDVGAGGGDLLAAIAEWGIRRGVAMELTGLDRSPWAATHATARSVPARWITADLFELDPGLRFDAVVCSLFTHHLDDATLVRFLRWIDARALRGWLISDLHRHWLPWSVVWAGVRVLRMAPMVVHDSTVSVARGFVRAEWERAVAAAGVDARIRWTFPFRWLVSRA